MHNTNKLTHNLILNKNPMWMALLLGVNHNNYNSYRLNHIIMQLRMADFHKRNCHLTIHNIIQFKENLSCIVIQTQQGLKNIIILNIK